MKTYLGFTYSPQMIQDIDEFVSSLRTKLDKSSTTNSCSPMDPLQWMGAVIKQLIKQSTSNPHDSSPNN